MGKVVHLTLRGLDEKSIVYALRCVNATKEGTPERIGIGKMTLDRLVKAKLVSTKGVFYSLTDTGRRYMMERGGPFQHG